MPVDDQAKLVEKSRFSDWCDNRPLLSIHSILFFKHNGKSTDQYRYDNLLLHVNPHKTSENVHTKQALMLTKRNNDELAKFKNKNMLKMLITKL